MPQVNIAMNAATVTGLLSSGSYLYAFRAVESSDKAGRPLVWQQIQGYSTSTPLIWQDLYEAYTSTSPIVENATIQPGFFAQIAPGQTLNVQPGGIGTVAAGGPASDISINNLTTTPYTCGLAQAGQNGGAFLPYCAFPLYGLNLQQITPLEKVLLTFSTQPIPPGTVIGSGLGFSSVTILASYSSSILIDLTGADARNVAYDLNVGWSWGGFSWAEVFPATADLVPLLIESP